MAETVGYLARVAVSTDGGSIYNDIAEVKDPKLTYSVNKADATTVDDAGWAVKKAVKNEATLSFICNYDVTDAQQQAVRAAQDAHTALYFRYRPEGDTSTKEQYICIGEPQVDIDAPTEDISKMSVEIEIESKPTRGTVP